MIAAHTMFCLFAGSCMAHSSCRYAREIRSISSHRIERTLFNVIDDS